MFIQDSKNFQFSYIENVIHDAQKSIKKNKAPENIQDLTKIE